MVDSPAYPCQFVLVVNDAAVLNAECADTAAKPWGFHGSQPCRRCRAYRPSIDTQLNARSDAAYSVQRISRAGSTWHVL